MAEVKNSFIAYHDWGLTFDQLPDEVAGRLIKHLFDYVNGKEPGCEDYVIKALFASIKSTIDRDKIKWEESKEKASINGRIGNLKRYNYEIYKRLISKELSLEEAEGLANSRPPIAPDRPRSPKVAKLAVSVSDSVSVNGNHYTTLHDSKDNSSSLTQKNYSFRDDLKKLGVSDQIASDWMKVRKKLKAVDTETAFKKIKKQIDIAMIRGIPPDDCIRIAVEKNWRGYEWAWHQRILEEEQKHEANGKSKIDQINEQRRAAAYAEYLEASGVGVSNTQE